MKGSLAPSLVEITSDEIKKENPYPKQDQPTPFPPMPKVKNMSTFSNNSEFIFISYLLHQWKFRVMIFLDSYTYVYRHINSYRRQMIFKSSGRGRSNNF
jgi:hypothetical protein